MSADVRDSKIGKAAADAAADLTKQGQRAARGIDQQLKDYTGRSSEAWLDDGARLIKGHPWKAVAAIAVVAYLFGKLRG